jgi:hypothetical protein
MEEITVTAEVFQCDPEKTHTISKASGQALGLVRMKDIHMGKIQDLLTQIKENETDIVKS